MEESLGHVSFTRFSGRLELAVSGNPWRNYAGITITGIRGKEIDCFSSGSLSVSQVGL